MEKSSLALHSTHILNSLITQKCYLKTMNWLKRAWIGPHKISASLWFSKPKANWKINSKQVITQLIPMSKSYDLTNFTWEIHLNRPKTKPFFWYKIVNHIILTGVVFDKKSFLALKIFSENRTFYFEFLHNDPFMANNSSPKKSFINSLFSTKRSSSCLLSQNSLLFSSHPYFFSSRKKFLEDFENSLTFTFPIASSNSSWIRNPNPNSRIRLCQ